MTASRAASPLDAAGAPAGRQTTAGAQSDARPAAGEAATSSPYLPLHPLATLFPAIEGADFDAFVDDIAEHGQREPIVTLDDQVLDGRNRQAACERLGLVPDYVAYDGDDPLAFVFSRNLTRRHLSESQRAMVAASLVSMELGMNQHSPKADDNGGSANLPTREAARRLSISERAVAAARAIRRAGAPALIAAIRDGHVSVHAGEALKRLPDAEVQRLVKAGDRAVLDAAKRLRTEKMTASRDNRLSLLSAISERGRARPAAGDALGGQLFPILYVDPPWKQEDVWSDETGQDRGYPYPTLTLDEICALCAGVAERHATDDAALFLWRTANRAPQGLKVMEAMGFTFVTELAWNKVARGTGRWVIDCHEVLMIGKRGSIPCPLPGTQPLSLYTEQKTAHSAKPAYFRDVIDTMFPGLAKLELFARGTAPEGWVFEGFESEGVAA